MSQNQHEDMKADLEKAAETRATATPFRYLEINLSDHCNLACSWCYAQYGTGKDYDREQTQWRIYWYMTQLREKQGRIHILGGEPLLEWDGLVETVKWANHMFKKPIRFSITTNGTLLTPDKQRMLQRLRVGAQVSIDGCAEAQNISRVTKKGRGTAQMLFSNVRCWVHHNPSATARMTVSPKTVHLAFESVEFLAENMKFRNITPILAGGITWTDVSLGIYKEQVTQITDWWVQKLRRGAAADIYYLRNILIRFHSGKPKTNACGAGIGGVAICTDNILWPCHRFANPKTDRKWALGTVREGVTNWQLRQKLMELDVSVISQCAECAGAIGCRKLCLHDSMTEKGDIFAVDDHTCRIWPFYWAEAMRADKALKGNRFYEDWIARHVKGGKGNCAVC